MVTWFYIFLLVQLINFQSPCAAISHNSLATDESALLALKAHITFDLYETITRNWSTDSGHVCTWIGVTCGSRHRRVMALNMSSMGVAGTIPPQLGNLSFLVSLDLSYNHFRGSLPPELSRLQRLKFLSLEVNKFNGEIPSWLGLLDKLVYLSLSNNSFTSFAPDSFANMSNVESLDISINSLQGTIPESLGNLRRLQILDMEDNHLSGSIPSSIFNLSRAKNIAFSLNNLNGSLPTNVWRNLPFLEEIHLSQNQLSGHIPLNLSECSQLRRLSLSYNFFSGQIPREIGMLKYLQILFIGGNSLNGAIPKEISNLQRLVKLGVEKNNITGEVPINIFNISSLQILLLHGNKLSGSIPREIMNLTNLKDFNINDNEFTGFVPQEICQLEQLESLGLSKNRFNPSTPRGIFNMSSLRILELSMIGLVGSLPKNIGHGLPALEILFLSGNNLSGVVPHSISNCSQLKRLALDANKFIGLVPYSLGNLRLLQELQLQENYLTTEPSSPESNFITALTKCKYLNALSINDNSVVIIPASIGNLSSYFWYFDANNCKIKGFIPAEIGNLTNLSVLGLGGNSLTGNIPLSITNLHNLQVLDLHGNKISGSIPKGFCNLQKLGDVYLSRNQFTGPIPGCLGNITSLRHLYLYSNMLTSSIPTNIWLLSDLLELDLSTNLLHGFLSGEISNLARAISIDLSVNQISGDIPNSIGKLQDLEELYLEHNKLKGIIPTSIGTMINLQTLDLSANNLSGSIPMSLQQLQFLTHFNVSFNTLIGEIPTGGPFKNFSMESFKGNEALCGIARFNISPCPVVSKKKPRTKTMQTSLFIIAAIFACVLVGGLTFVFNIRRKETNRDGVEMPQAVERISYYELLRATEHFSERNLLGVGSFGSVYKGTLRDGKVLAIKVFNLQSEGAFKSFDVECEVLRNIRHRNLNKVLVSCSNEDFKAFVLEYMPNESLENWLYAHNYFLDVKQSLNIMIDVASALEYLHHGYSMPIVHCDLKPSNVLLDDTMTAHVSDFGIAKMLVEGHSIVHTNTLATLGYIAPEYGMDGLVSTRCDVYSYGIMLMEICTRKRPSDEMFTGDMSIKTWVEDFYYDSPSRVIDANLLNQGNLDKNLQCMLDVLNLALKCSVESPGERINMKDVVVELQKIKQRFLA